MQVLGFLIPIAIAIASIFYLFKIARFARETYGIGMIFDWSFALVVVSIFCLFIGLALTGGEEGYQMTSEDVAKMTQNGVVLILVGCGLLGWGGYRNVRRSTTKFGIWFTFLQIVAAVGIIVPAFMIFANFKTKKVMPQMWN